MIVTLRYITHLHALFKDLTRDHNLAQLQRIEGQPMS